MHHRATAAAFEQLDDYETPVHTRVSRPRRVEAPRPPPAHRLPLAPETMEPWPFHTEGPGGLQPHPHPYWTSRFAEECDWLRTLPQATTYAAAYWERNGCLPALGHLHFLYDRHGYHGGASGAEPTVECSVELVSELCVCDCAITPGGGGCAADGLGVQRLIAHLAATVCTWQTALDRTAVEEAVRDAPEELRRRVLRACCEGQAQGDLRLLDHPNGAPIGPWVTRVARTVGTNLDIHPLLLQTAALMDA